MRKRVVAEVVTTSPRYGMDRSAHCSLATSRAPPADWEFLALCQHAPLHMAGVGVEAIDQPRRGRPEAEGGRRVAAVTLRAGRIGERGDAADRGEGRQAVCENRGHGERTAGRREAVLDE